MLTKVPPLAPKVLKRVTRYKSPLSRVDKEGFDEYLKWKPYSYSLSNILDTGYTLHDVPNSEIFRCRVVVSITICVHFLGWALLICRFFKHYEYRSRQSLRECCVFLIKLSEEAIDSH
jgi:hypothetical protein